MKDTPQISGGQSPEIIRENEADEIPHGREEVMKAIIDAAEALLIERSPSDFSVREIAQLAKVKHPMIHRYFGTKDEVILAVHARNIDKVHAKIRTLETLEGNIDKFVKAIKDNKMRQVSLARAMIDGVDPKLLQHQYPSMHHGLELLRKRQKETNSDIEPEIAAAVLGGTILGWILFEPFLKAALGMEDRDPKEVENKVVEFLEEVVRKVF